MEEESAKRKERLQAMRMEAGQSNTDPVKDKESSQSAPGLLSNPLIDSSVTPTSHISTRFDYYTDPLAAFSGNRKNGRTNQNNSKSAPSESPNAHPNIPRAMISPTNGSIPTGSYNQQQNFHSGNLLSPGARAPFGSPISKHNFPSGPQYYSSPCGLSTSSNESPLPVPPVSRFNYPSPPLLGQHQQQNQSSPQHRGFFNSNNGSPLSMSPGPRFNTWSQPSPHQSGTQPRRFYNSSNESPASMTSDPRFSNTPRNDTFWSQQPYSQQQYKQSTESPAPLIPVPRFNTASNMDSFGSPEIHSQPLPPSQQQHQQDQSGSQRRHHSGLPAPGSSWLDPRRSPGGRGSPRSEPHGSGSPSYGSSGSGASWSEPRGRGSSGRGQAWMNSRGRGGRGLGGSPSPNQVQGGRGSRVHASAREIPDLFVKKSMVEDPWKNLVPILMDSLADIEIGNTKMFRSKGVCFDLDNSGSCQSGSISLKKPKILQIKDDLRSGPSLAESLALAFSDAIREESRNCLQTIQAMDVSDKESHIIVTSPAISVSLNDVFETEVDKCTRLIVESCINIVKAVEHTTLMIDYVEELEKLKMKDVAKLVRETFVKVDAFPSMTKEVYHDHCANKGHNTNFIIKEYVMYLHHYGELFYI